MTMLQRPFHRSGCASGTEKSQQANAVQTVRESALTHSHRSGQRPIFNRSKELMQAPIPSSALSSPGAAPRVPTSAAAPSTFLMIAIAAAS